jgi:hypothetical protein
MRRLPGLLSLSLLSIHLTHAAEPAKVSSSWTFVVSGDSRNCGDIIMPVIASRTRVAGARFYWHLGDLRALYKVDEDYAGLHRNAPDMLTNDAYLKEAWKDFQDRQVAPFGTLPFFLGIGNHELIKRTRDDFVTQFSNLLDIDKIRKQRETDDPNDHTVRTYYHWIESGIDFINMDNADSLFDGDQLAWATKVITADETKSDVKIVIVGMHESLPDSYTFDHSMNQGSDKGDSGRTLYQRLLDFRQKTGKPVHVFSSHSHYYLTNIYNTGTLQSKGVLPGWLVGTAGAQHYSIPPEVKSFTTWAENEYGYAVVRVTPDTGTLNVRFVPVKRTDITSKLISDFGQSTVDFCFTQNWRASLHTDNY